MSYKSTNHIFTHPYEKMPKVKLNYFSYPTSESSESVEFSDIKMWQQLYYEPGFIGVYAAYNPKVELYMITYNMFIKQEKGYELFSGNDAVERVIDKCKVLGINLEPTVEELTTKT